MDYYNVLGVSRSANDSDLKKAFKKKSMEHHPDRGGDAEKFKEINEAYQALKDPEKRQMYDQFGTTDPQHMGGHPGGGQSFHFHSGPGGFNINDLFGQFGMGMNARQQMRNRDITIGCRISIEDVFSGKTVIANYRLANGKEQTVEIKIPVGIRQGDKIRYQGMGQHDIGQIPPGDLFVQIEIQDSNNFLVDGLDLVTSKRVSVLSLITGTNVKIDIPGNTVVDLKLKPGTQSGTTMRITGKGLLNRGGGQGNVLVKIIGITPTSLEKADLQQIEYINQKYS